MTLIKLSNITKNYPDGANSYNHILHGVEMEVRHGEFVAVMGASGSGKTTLLSILGTLLSADTGSYLLNGEEMLRAGVNHSAVRNKQIGFVFQEHRLLPQLTVMDNILLPTLAYQPEATKEQMEYARHLLDVTGIVAVAGQYPQAISGGEASRAALCRALIMKPLLLLADEPTGQLDADNSQNIVSLLSRINKESGTTILMVTHSTEVAASAHRLLTLKNGVLK
jgi:ABC-type lipoprotein export system ATPase subunit